MHEQTIQFQNFCGLKNVTKMLVKYETTSLNEIWLIFQSEMSNFAMGTISGKGFAQAQVHTEFIAQVPKGMRIHTDFNKRLFVWHLILNQSE